MPNLAPIITLAFMPGIKQYLYAMAIVLTMEAFPLDYTQGSLMREVSYVAAAASLPPGGPKVVAFRRHCASSGRLCA